MDVSAFRKTKTIEIAYEDETVKVSYVRAAITPEWEQAFNEAIKDEWRSRAVVESLARVIAEWDLTDGGKPFPPTVENLVTLPTQFLVTVFTAIMEDQRPN